MAAHHVSLPLKNPWFALHATKEKAALMDDNFNFLPSVVQATRVPSNQHSGASGNLVAEVTKVLASADRSRLSVGAQDAALSGGEASYWDVATFADSECFVTDGHVLKGVWR